VFSELSNKQFIPFLDGCLLFDKTEQSVLILNQTAAFIWCASFDAVSKNELTNLLADNFSISSEQAQQDIEQFYNHVQKNHLFLAKEDKLNSFLIPIDYTKYCSSYNKSAALVFSIHQNIFNLTLPTIELRTELVHIYGHFIQSEADAASINIDHTIDVCIETTLQQTSFSIYCDQQCVAKDLLIENVVPYVFGIVFETSWHSQLKKDSAHTLMFHAAVLAQDKGAILFPAESGAGKSTLAAVLASKGWQFFTDELAIIAPESLSVFPCPLSICVKPGSVDFLSAYYPQLGSLKQYQRLDNKKVRYLPVPPPAPGSSIQKKIRAVIFPQYNKKIQCQLQPVDKKEALKRFLNCGSSGRPLTTGELSSVAAMIEQLPCYALNYLVIDQAIEEIEFVLDNS